MLYKMTFFSSIRNANIFSFLMSISSVSVSQSSISDKVAPFTHPQDEYEEVSPTDLAARILNGYENVVNSLMILAGGGRHRTKIMPSEYQATLTLEQDEKVFTYIPSDVKTAELRTEKVGPLAESISDFGIGTFCLKIELPANTLDFKPLKVGSHSSLFNKEECRLTFKESGSGQSIIIENPVNLYESGINL